jgi:hypothetical protein
MKAKTLVHKCHQNLLELHSRLCVDVIDDHSKAVALAAAKKLAEDAAQLVEAITRGVPEPLPKSPPCVANVGEGFGGWDEALEDGTPRSPLIFSCQIEARAKARKLLREVLDIPLEVAARSVPTDAGPEVSDRDVERLDAALKAHRIDAKVSRR